MQAIATADSAALTRLQTSCHQVLGFATWEIILKKGNPQFGMAKLVYKGYTYIYTYIYITVGFMVGISD
jgi:hypothetical protein